MSFRAVGAIYQFFAPMEEQDFILRSPHRKHIAVYCVKCKLPQHLLFIITTINFDFRLFLSFPFALQFHEQK